MPDQLDILSAAATGPRHASQLAKSRTRWVLFIPLAGFLVAGALFYSYLGRDVHRVPSPLIGKPVPQFSLPPVKGRQSLA